MWLKPYPSSPCKNRGFARKVAIICRWIALSIIALNDYKKNINSQIKKNWNSAHWVLLLYLGFVTHSSFGCFWSFEKDCKENQLSLNKCRGRRRGGMKLNFVSLKLFTAVFAYTVAFHEYTISKCFKDLPFNFYRLFMHVCLQECVRRSATFPWMFYLFNATDFCEHREIK